MVLDPLSESFLSWPVRLEAHPTSLFGFDRGALEVKHVVVAAHPILKLVLVVWTARLT
jgi:hypothetical protein